MPTPAMVLAPGMFRDVHAKVAHGLVRGSSRFDIVGVIDASCAGQDAGEVLDGRVRGIPLFASIAECLQTVATPVEVCILGIATHGGRFTDEVRGWLLEAIDQGLGVINGLHDSLQGDAEIAAAGAARGVSLVDVRRLRKSSQLRFWTGAIQQVRAPRIAVLGTDCAIGKRTTTFLLVEALRQSGVRAEMIYTGQTGWMQGARFGLILDSTLNDYVGGEIERAVVECQREANPEVMILECQSALRNPFGPCGSELLLSAAASGVILQHAPGRKYFEGYEDLQVEIPSLQSEIELLRLYGVPVVAVSLNGEGLDDQALQQVQQHAREELQIPVVRVLEEGIEPLVDATRDFLATAAEARS